MTEEPITEPDTEDAPVEAPMETFEVNYSCLRCGTAVANAELSRLPEIKCICGFRVFTKIRPPVVKTVKAI
ncbi:MAG: RNA polymerase Rbp10 [Nitrosopumilus sp. B06]|nr:MAG: RNA polymerase Rbp10 [Nitrosopumilus sp. D6]RNJ78448.1 MAG: RNA polymerase Rbp10 [Nitrosopumilus sp. B06]